MKKLLLTIFLMSAISIPAFALTPPYFGVFSQVQGLTYTGGVYTSLDIGGGMELMIGNKWFFYYRAAAFGTIASSAEQYRIYLNGGLGAGYRLLDLREDNKGHLLAMSFTISPLFDFGEPSSESYSVDNSKPDFTDHSKTNLTSFSLGGEVFVTYYYNVFKHFALRAGLNFGAFYTKYDEVSITYLGNNTTIKTKVPYSSGLSLTYGLSVGLAF